MQIDTTYLADAKKQLIKCNQYIKNIYWLQKLLEKECNCSTLNVQNENNQMALRIMQLTQLIDSYIKFACDDERLIKQATKKTSHKLVSKVSTMKFTYRNHTTLKKEDFLLKLVTNGVCAGFFIGFDAYKKSWQLQNGAYDVGTKVEVGSISASGDARFALFRKRKFKPRIILKGEAKAVLASLAVDAAIGNSMMGLSGDASVEVGAVQGEVKGVLKADEITFKAEGKVSALSGEATGVLRIFGIKISATISGDVGSIGASAEYSTKKGEFVIGGSASLFAGAGFKIRVNY